MLEIQRRVDDAHHDEIGNQPGAQGSQLVLAVGEAEGQDKDQGQLHELGGLHGGEAQIEPAPGAVDFVANPGNADQSEQNDAEHGQDRRDLAQHMVIHPGGQPHHKHATHTEDGLFEQKFEFVAEPVHRIIGARRENHQQADGHQQQHQCQQGEVKILQPLSAPLFRIHPFRRDFRHIPHQTASSASRPNTTPTAEKTITIRFSFQPPISK